MQVVTFKPFTLLPSPVPKAIYLQALRVQTHFNSLMDKISRDAEFLEEALAGYSDLILKNIYITFHTIKRKRKNEKAASLSHCRCVQVDEFTGKLFGILKQVQEEGRTQVIE